MALVEIDCRQMAPPEPMVQVLTALQGLAPGDRVLMVHRHNPVHLLPILSARGFAYRFQTQTESLVELLIWRLGDLEP